MDSVPLRPQLLWTNNLVAQLSLARVKAKLPLSDKISSSIAYMIRLSFLLLAYLNPHHNPRKLLAFSTRQTPPSGGEREFKCLIQFQDFPESARETLKKEELFFLLKKEDSISTRVFHSRHFSFFMANTYFASSRHRTSLGFIVLTVEHLLYKHSNLIRYIMNKITHEK